MRWGVVAAFAVAVYFAFFGGRYSVFETRSAERAREMLRARLDSIERVNSALEARIDSLEHDPTTLEQVAREEYGMVRPGERLYRMTTPDSTLDTPEAEPR